LVRSHSGLLRWLRKSVKVLRPFVGSTPTLTAKPPEQRPVSGLATGEPTDLESDRLRAGHAVGNSCSGVVPGEHTDP
jgi:hypothetical protein